VTFQVSDAARLSVSQPFDVAFVFDALHDQVDPAGCCGASTPRSSQAGCS